MQHGPGSWITKHKHRMNGMWHECDMLYECDTPQQGNQPQGINTSTCIPCNSGHGQISARNLYFSSEEFGPRIHVPVSHGLMELCQGQNQTKDIKWLTYCKTTWTVKGWMLQEHEHCALLWVKIIHPKRTRTQWGIFLRPWKGLPRTRIWASMKILGEQS